MDINNRMRDMFWLSKTVKTTVRNAQGFFPGVFSRNCRFWGGWRFWGPAASSGTLQGAQHAPPALNALLGDILAPTTIMNGSNSGAEEVVRTKGLMLREMTEYLFNC